MALLLVLPDLRVILDVPAVVSIEGKPGGEPVRLGAQPLIEREHQLAVWGRDADVVALVRVTRPVIRESRHVVVAAQAAEGQVQDELIAVVDDLEGGAEVASAKASRDAPRQLSARRAGESGIPHAAIVAIERAD